jgi:hypothetical protein
LGQARNQNQRTASAFIFGAISPDEGKGAGLVMPACNTEATSLHLVEIAKEVAPGKHAVLFLGQVGWHTSSKLVTPENITILPLPAKCQELNPVENLCEYNAIAGSPTGSSGLTPTSSTIVAKPGTNS